MHQKGQTADAECGYRRILEVQPKHADTLHRLGQLLVVKGNHAEAKRLFRTLTMVRPDAVKAWLCLAQVCEKSWAPSRSGAALSRGHETAS